MANLDKIDEEFNNFMHRVTEVDKIVKKLSSNDKELQDIGALEADRYLKNSDRSFYENIDEQNVRLSIKNDRTVINKKALMKSEDQATMSQESFMEEVSKDAERRYKDKQVRKEKMETFKKQASLAFRRGEYERALNCYNKAIEQIRDSCMLYNNRCLTNIQLNLYDNAISDAKLALRLDEDSIRARLLLAKAHFLNGNMQDYESTIAEAKRKHENQIEFINDFAEKLKISTNGE